MAKGSETGGCLNCYAARMASRNLPELKSPTTGKPFARILASGPRWTGDVELIEKALLLPLRWQRPRRIFVNSMSDLFHEELRDDEINRVFAVMALCPQHIFQILTKRAERMRAYLDNEDVAARVDSCAWEIIEERVDPNDRRSDDIRATALSLDDGPLPNVWLGTSVENQPTADARIPHLLRTPAAKRFVSYEPALGPVRFWKLGSLDYHENTIGYETYPLAGLQAMPDCDWEHSKLDWIIVGGESGPGARPFDIQWARDTIRQCKEAGVACFVKQLGANPMYRSHGDDHPAHLFNGLRTLYSNGHPLNDRKGGDWEEWDADLRVREFPC